MIYFDHNATTHLSSSVLEYVHSGLVEDWGNPSSEHAVGHALSLSIDEIRSKLADFLSCSTESLVFTSSATESINTVLNPTFLKSQSIQHVVTSAMEHSATLKACEALEESGVLVSFVKTCVDGSICYKSLEELLQKKRGLISVMYVNNETGVINDISKMSELAACYNSKLHIDGVQALGKIPLNLDAMNVDFMSFSGHKIGAFKGIGLLYAKERKAMMPLIYGGGQEFGLRSGTYNFPAIKSLALAVGDLDFTRRERVADLRRSFEEEILNLAKGFEINGGDLPRVDNTSNIYFKGIDARLLLLLLSEGSNTICVSSGAACKSGLSTPSHVIQNVYGEQRAQQSLRFSFAPSNTDAELKIFFDVLKKRI